MKIAVITPYYKEHERLLTKCHASVKAQTAEGVRHIFVSDGYPNAFIDTLDADHVKITPCGDYGDTPRGIGAAIAAAQGYDAICFLDADCWYEPEHIAEMLECAKRTQSEVITCPRNLYRSNSTFMYVDGESDGTSFNDTNCYMVMKSAFYLLRGWMLKDKKLSIQGDRYMWANIAKSGVKISRTFFATVNYITTFSAHYLKIDETPPDESRVMVVADGETKTISYLQYKQHLESKKK